MSRRVLKSMEQMAKVWEIIIASKQKNWLNHVSFLKYESRMKKNWFWINFDQVGRGWLHPTGKGKRMWNRLKAPRRHWMCQWTRKWCKMMRILMVIGNLRCSIPYFIHPSTVLHPSEGRMYGTVKIISFLGKIRRRGEGGWGVISDPKKIIAVYLK